jgi:glucose/arabinose dehydrogenase
VSDKRLFVLEESGRIRVINGDGHLLPKPFLDIHEKVLFKGEMGLLGLVFHPDYTKNGYLYINYIDKNQETVIARYSVSEDAKVADANSEKVLFRLKQPYPNHKAGNLAFGPDGYLYASLGDGGSHGDPQNRAQNKKTFFGKILRLDVDRGSPYSVPQTNPFVGEESAHPEIWAYGLRNPWRFSFDKTTGDLFIADVGQNAYEEINMQPAASKGGQNYGWRCYEAGHSYEPSGCKPQSHYTAPILEYPHTEGRCSVTGGYVYRGKHFPALTGKYFFGDYCGGQLYQAVKSGAKWQMSLAEQTPYQITTFGQGSDGELYFADYGSGSIYQITNTEE